LRKLLAERKQEMTATQQPGITSVQEEDMVVPARDGYQIPIRVYKPESALAGDSSLIMFYHGGRFCLGDLEMEEMNCRRFANEFGALCVNVYYRLAPEHPCPTSINDSRDAFKWVSNLQMSDSWSKY